MTILTDENRYQLLKLLEQNPNLNQRQLAQAMGISLGKTNYCINVLIENGLVKVKNFKRNSSSKMSYTYYLTPKGIDEKARTTIQFLKHKQHEYEVLAQQLEELKKEAKLIRQVHKYGAV